MRASASAQVTKRLQLQGTFSDQRAIFYSASPFAGHSTSATLALVYQPSERWLVDLRGTYSGFSRASDGRRLYDYAIYRTKTTYQWNRYLFFRGIAEYNSYRRQLVTDLLASFTYIPGTVFHAGYGSLFEKVRWQEDRFVPHFYGDKEDRYILRWRFPETEAGPGEAAGVAGAGEEPPGGPCRAVYDRKSTEEVDAQ